MLALRWMFAVALVAASWSVTVGRADDFRVTTELFNEGQKTPSSTNLTVFHAGRVYDFLTQHSENNHTESQVSIFDPLKGRFILLDPARKVKVEIEKDRLVELSGSLRTWVASRNDPLLRFAAEPKFNETTGSKPDEILFTSQVLSYRVLTFSPTDSPEMSKVPDMAKQYRDFTDQYARLNAITNPGSLPPFPRLAVNEALSKRGLAPREVELTIPSNKLFGKAVTRRTEHTFEPTVIRGDEDRIAKAGQWMAEFTKISLDEYIRPSPGVAQK